MQDRDNTRCTAGQSAVGNRRDEHRVCKGRAGSGSAREATAAAQQRRKVGAQHASTPSPACLQRQLLPRQFLKISKSVQLTMMSSCSTCLHGSKGCVQAPAGLSLPTQHLPPPPRRPTHHRADDGGQRDEEADDVQGAQEQLEAALRLVDADPHLRWQRGKAGWRRKQSCTQLPRWGMCSCDTACWGQGSGTAS